MSEKKESTKSKSLNEEQEDRDDEHVLGEAITNFTEYVDDNVVIIEEETEPADFTEWTDIDDNAVPSSPRSPRSNKKKKKKSPKGKKNKVKRSPPKSVSVSFADETEPNPPPFPTLPIRVPDWALIWPDGRIATTKITPMILVTTDMSLSIKPSYVELPMLNRRLCRTNLTTDTNSTATQ